MDPGGTTGETGGSGIPRIQQRIVEIVERCWLEDRNARPGAEDVLSVVLERRCEALACEGVLICDVH